MFKFRLQSVMNLREHKEKTCREEVAVCIRLLAAEVAKQKEIEDKIRRLAQELRFMQEGRLSLNELILYNDYLKFLKYLLRVQQKAVEERREQLREARARLLEAMKERKF